MTNSTELELQIKRLKLSKKYIAKQLGITEMSLFNKIGNVTEFKASEIVTLTKVLQLSAEQRDLIFFSSECDLKS